MPDYHKTSIAGIFLNHVEKYGDRVCVSHKKNGQYTDISWAEMGRMVRQLAALLISMGIQRGDKVGIFSHNRFEWWVSDLSVLSIGAVDVPIYATNSAEEALYALDHGDVRACFTGEKEHLEKILEIKDRLPKLEFMISYDPVEKTSDSIFTFSDALQKGEQQEVSKEISDRLSSIIPSDPATILYTSGTTGPPKGVVLTHDNFVSNVRQIQIDVGSILSDDEVFLSFLPLSHVLERTAGYYLAMFTGAKVVFAESFSRLQQNLVEVRPTAIISVPRLYEKIHAGIYAKVKKAAVHKKMLFGWAIKISSRNLPYMCLKKKRKGFFAFQYWLADKLMFSKLKKAIGMDRIRFSVSGGGPLTVSDGEFFLGMEILLLEGYGLTETTPVTHVNRPWKIKPGTVGPPLKDTLVKFSDKSEILIKGPQVMPGYYNDDEGTREVFTKDGFFKTGDMGREDEEGYLTITGRLKEIIITSGGKNISPQRIEFHLKDSRYIEQACVIGDRRKYLSVLLVPDFQALRQWAEYKEIPFKDHKDLIRKQAVVTLFQREVDTCNQHFSQVEKIKRFRLLSTEWTQDTGELTPTLKVKRRILNKKYNDIIEEMYEADSEQ